MHPRFQIYTDISSLPISEHEAYQEEGFCGICTGGSAVIEVFSVRSPISENDIVTIRSEERRVGKECRSRWSPYH